MAIPRILHQIWNTETIPAEFKGYQQSWFKYHPDWRYRLWTLRDQYNFLEQHYPWFLPLYDAYRVPIKRADAFRYFLLWHYGGIYADLDVEFLRPIDPLLTNKKLVLGKEPEEHLSTNAYKYRRFKFIICNAIIASIPGHSFWPFVIEELIARRFVHQVINATGPVMLTDAYNNYSYKNEISLESSEEVYPVSQMRTLKGAVTDSERDVFSKNGAYTIHHWSGSWSEEFNNSASDLNCYVLDLGRGADEDRFLKISCLMAYRGRLEMAKRAVHCFRMQAWPAKELVIVDEQENDALHQWIEWHNISQIRYVKLPPKDQPLGELRNLAAQHATGEYFSLWDEEDISSPLRLSRQMAAIKASAATVCIMNRNRFWQPDKKLIFDSAKRLWENSILCRKSKFPSYPEICKNGDNPGIMDVIANSRVAVLDEPELLTIELIDKNPLHTQINDRLEQNATRIYKGAEYHCLHRDMNHQTYLSVMDLSCSVTTGMADPGPLSADQQGPDHTSAIPLNYRRHPTIHIMVPVRNSEHVLDKLFTNLDNLICQNYQISISFLDDNSADDTYKELKIYKKWFKNDFTAFNVLRKDKNAASNLASGVAANDPYHSFITAKMCNHLLFRSSVDEDFVLWMSPQVSGWSSDIIETMLSYKKDIITAHCVSEPGGASADFSSWKYKVGANEKAQSAVPSPQKILNRLYMDDLREHDLVQLDSVGCAMLLVRADIHRDGLTFPVSSYQGFYDAEGLSNMAREMGYQCHGLPNVEVVYSSD